MVSRTNDACTTWLPIPLTIWESQAPRVGGVLNGLIQAFRKAPPDPGPGIPIRILKAESRNPSQDSPQPLRIVDRPVEIIRDLVALELAFARRRRCFHEQSRHFFLTHR